MLLAALVPPGVDREATGAVLWARARGYVVRAVEMDAAASFAAHAGGVPAPPALAADEILWCHAGRAVPTLPGAWRAPLSNWVSEGGRVLLSLLAAPLARELGAPDDRPHVEGPRQWRHADDPCWSAGFRDWPGYPHVRGAQGAGRHPLFDGFVHGTYTWTATDGEAYARCVLQAPRWPQAPRGRVLAIDRAYVQFDVDTAVAWEYDVGQGRILCLGANVAFSAGDRRLELQRDRYLANALAYLDPSRDVRGVRRDAWGGRAKDTRTVRSAATGGGAPYAAVPAALPPARAHEGHLDGEPTPPALAPVGSVPEACLVMEGRARPEAPFTIAGRRALVVGDERSGVREAWLHPLCVLSEGMRLTVAGTPLVATAVRVTPGAVVRTLCDGEGGEWREVVAAAPDAPLIRYDLSPLDGMCRTRVTLEAAMRVRLQWPLPSDMLQPLVVRHRSAEGRVLVRVTSPASPMVVQLTADGVLTASVQGDVDAARLSLTGRPGEGVRLAIAASPAGDVELSAAWRELQRDSLAQLLSRLSARDARRREATVRIDTPDTQYDDAWEWAKARLASCLVHVPGLGTGLVAGYAGSRPGWGDSRPGYAWYFGRDACWSGDALLAAGMFDEARTALEFMASTADVSGKIAHEVTTSGASHYDAADATPLWLRFVARYAEWTGDLATVRALRGAIHAAVRFVGSHDADGDGLPDNTGVGHGWIESGALGGGAVTSYTAAIWIDALQRLVPLAERVGDHWLASWVKGAHAQAARTFEERLRDPETGRVLLHRLADGTPCRDLTALAAVPILVGVDRAPSADTVVERLADEDFAPPWGVRLLSRSDPRYAPRGYHLGAVWPLYTGWVSLASFARGRPALGWRHLRAVADCAFHRARGAFDEVLDGDTGAAAGVCPDQAWSAAMVITPFVEGALGMVPCAPERRCTLAPQWPPAWRSARVRGLRVGESWFSLEMTLEGDDRYRYTVSLDAGPPLVVQLAGEGEEVGALVPGARRTVERTAARSATHGGTHERR